MQASLGLDDTRWNELRGESQFTDTTLTYSARHLPAVCYECVAENPESYPLDYWDTWTFACLGHSQLLSTVPSNWHTPNRPPVSRGKRPAQLSQAPLPAILEAQRWVESLARHVKRPALERAAGTGIVALNLDRHLRQSFPRTISPRRLLQHPADMGTVLAAGLRLCSGTGRQATATQRRFARQARHIPARTLDRIYEQHDIEPLLSRRRLDRTALGNFEQWPQLMPTRLFTADIADELQHLSWLVARHVAVLACLASLGCAPGDTDEALGIVTPYTVSTLNAQLAPLRRNGRVDRLRELLAGKVGQLQNAATRNNYGDRRRHVRAATAEQLDGLHGGDSTWPAEHTRLWLWYDWAASYPLHLLDSRRGLSVQKLNQRTMRLADSTGKPARPNLNRAVPAAS